VCRELSSRSTGAKFIKYKRRDIHRSVEREQRKFQHLSELELNQSRFSRDFFVWQLFQQPIRTKRAAPQRNWSHGSRGFKGQSIDRRASERFGRN
jgi:hypothetical protein